jgi:hypothetical protein
MLKKTASATSQVGGWMIAWGKSEFAGGVIRSLTMFPVIYSLSNLGSRLFSMIYKQPAT